MNLYPRNHRNRALAFLLLGLCASTVTGGLIGKGCFAAAAAGLALAGMFLLLSSLNSIKP